MRARTCKKKKCRMLVVQWNRDRARCMTLHRTPRGSHFGFLMQALVKDNRYIDLAAVKRIPITRVLSHLGIEPAARKASTWFYHAPWREDRNASLAVRLETNTWKDFGEDGSGTSNIDLLIRMGLAGDWRSAARWILDNEGAGAVAQASGISKSRPAKHPAMKRASLPEGFRVTGLMSERLFGYGESRGIPRDILREYCCEITYRSEAGRQHTVIGFGNCEGGYAARGLTQKCNLGPGSFTHIADGHSLIVNVFEGFFDFLSFKVLYPERTGEYIIENSTSNTGRVIERLKAGKYSVVNCFLDADDSGKEAFNKICLALPDTEVVDQSPTYGYGNKDLNDRLVNYSNLKKTTI